MVTTKHCCWGTCNSDSRYPQKLHPALKKLLAEGKPVFLPFPKKSQGLERCQAWVNACGRGEAFTVENVNKHVYICCLHWPGQAGPTDERDTPLKATLSREQLNKELKPKRKAPRERQVPVVCKKLRIDDDHEVSSGEADVYDSLNDEAESLNDNSENQSVDAGTQTSLSKYELALKVESLMQRNAAASTSSEIRKEQVSNMSYDIISKDLSLMKHFIGLTSSQFEILHDFLNEVCPLDKISYWSYSSKCKESNKPTRASKVNTRRNFLKLSSREKLYICLLRLRCGFTIKTMSVLLSTPSKQIKETTIRDIFTTFIQLMYKIFRDMETVMFPSRELYRRFLPKVFKTMRNIRCTVDCTEFRVETSRDFARQGNTYSQSKHCNTFKCLIAVAPNGGACFVSDMFEGDINDVEIFEESGILKHINPHDLILVDRGFTVQDLVNPFQARIKIPAFLKGRGTLYQEDSQGTNPCRKVQPEA